MKTLSFYFNGPLCVVCFNGTTAVSYTAYPVSKKFTIEIEPCTEVNKYWQRCNQQNFDFIKELTLTGLGLVDPTESHLAQIEAFEAEQALLAKFI